MPPVFDEMVPCSCQASQGKPSLNIEVWQTFRNNEIFLELVIFSSDTHSDIPRRRNAKIRFPGHQLKFVWWTCVGKDRKFGTLEKIQTHCSWPHFLPHSLFLCNRWSVFRSRKCFVREKESGVWGAPIGLSNKTWNYTKVEMAGEETSQTLSFLEFPFHL